MTIETNKAHLGRGEGGKNGSERGEEKKKVQKVTETRDSRLEEIEGTIQFWVTFIVFGSSLLQQLAVLLILSSIRYSCIQILNPLFLLR